MDFDWDDDELVQPRTADSSDDDDLFDFSTSLRIDDIKEKAAELPALAPGVEDVLGDRGVLLKRIRMSEGGASSADGASSAKEGEVTNGTNETDCVMPSATAPYVELHYEGFLVESGEKFDSSVEQGYPMIARLDLPPSGKGTLIRGWEAALPLLRAGEKAELTIASRYAYGEAGSAPDIPPHADLRFTLEVLDVRETHRRVVKVDTSRSDLSRLEEVRRDREVAQARREELQAEREKAREAKEARIAALREKLASKNKSKKGKKKKK